MNQLSLVRLLIFQAFVTFCYDIYIVSKNYSFKTPDEFIPILSPALIVLFIVLMCRIVMYFLLIKLSKKDGDGNGFLLLGSIAITVFGMIVVSEPTNQHGWEFLSIPIQFFCILVLWPVVALTNRSSNTD